MRPILLLLVGLTVRHRQRLPMHGPAIIIANHNSHMDTLAIMSLFPIKFLPKLRPVAAADYFLRNRFLSWFAIQVMGIIPLERSGRRHHVDPLAPCLAALDQGDILILFPEGTRGKPGILQSFHAGVAHLAISRPNIPVIPVFLSGLGQVLPKGSFIPLPLFCDVMVGQSMPADQLSKRVFLKMLEDRMMQMAGIAENSRIDGPG